MVYDPRSVRLEGIVISRGGGLPVPVVVLSSGEDRGGIEPRPGVACGRPDPSHATPPDAGDSGQKTGSLEKTPLNTET